MNLSVRPVMVMPVARLNRVSPFWLCNRKRTSSVLELREPLTGDEDATRCMHRQTPRSQLLSSRRRLRLMTPRIVGHSGYALQTTVVKVLKNHSILELLLKKLK